MVDFYVASLENRVAELTAELSRACAERDDARVGRREAMESGYELAGNLGRVQEERDRARADAEKWKARAEENVQPLPDAPLAEYVPWARLSVHAENGDNFELAECPMCSAIVAATPYSMGRHSDDQHAGARS